MKIQWEMRVLSRGLYEDKLMFEFWQLERQIVIPSPMHGCLITIA